jgi:hypothetical protein
MAARAAYDEAEAAALRERERIVGSYRDVMMVSQEQVRRQLAGERVAVPRSEGWYLEQRRRNEYAAFVTDPKIKAAQEALGRTTLDARSHFATELKGGRMSRSDFGGPADAPAIDITFSKHSARTHRVPRAPLTGTRDRRSARSPLV